MKNDIKEKDAAHYDKNAENDEHNEKLLNELGILQQELTIYILEREISERIQTKSENHIQLEKK